MCINGEIGPCLFIPPAFFRRWRLLFLFCFPEIAAPCRTGRTSRRASSKVGRADEAGRISELAIVQHALVDSRRPPRTATLKGSQQRTPSEREERKLRMRVGCLVKRGKARL